MESARRDWFQLRLRRSGKQSETWIGLLLFGGIDKELDANVKTTRKKQHAVPLSKSSDLAPKL